MNRRHFLGALSAAMLSTWAGASSAVAQVRATRAKSSATTRTNTHPLPTPRWPQIARVADVAVGQSVSFTFGSTSKYASGKNSCPGAWGNGHLVSRHRHELAGVRIHLHARGRPRGCTSNGFSRHLPGTWISVFTAHRSRGARTCRAVTARRQGVGQRERLRLLGE